MPAKLKPNERIEQGKTAGIQKRKELEFKRLKADSQFDPMKPRNYFLRSVDTKAPRKSFLIVCEGEKTEPQYFMALCDIWKIPAYIKIVGAAGNTSSVVDKAIELRDEDQDRYDEIWAVFDRDSFTLPRVRSAFTKAKNEDIKIAFSNEAFEFWYLLHYDFRDTGMNRDEYGEKLTKHMGIKYEKNDPKQFERLRQNLPSAVRNAKRIAKDFNMYDHQLINQNPYTGVYLLIKALMPEKKETVEETLRDCAMQNEEYEKLNRAFMK